MRKAIITLTCLLLSGCFGAYNAELSRECDQGSMSACMRYQDSLARSRTYAAQAQSYGTFYTAEPFGNGTIYRRWP